jgi:hypothetical protein
MAIDNASHTLQCAILIEIHIVQAVSHGHVNAAEMLVNKGADPNLQSLAGFEFKANP